MDTVTSLVIPLSAVTDGVEKFVGGKAAKLSRLARAGFRVPNGFCLTTKAYQEFVKDAKIENAIRMELGRKLLDDMRWEEIWDAALRIRSMFLAHPLSGPLQQAIRGALSRFSRSTPLAVRSSALGEDSAERSFAGLHESFTDVKGEHEIWDAVRLVWASLWSDAALLYRQELRLDPASSRMAVLVQEMVKADRSGVAFGRDPRDTRRNCAIIEAVPGPCSLLVDGEIDPDRWEMHRETRQVLTWLPGQRDEIEQDDNPRPLLETADLQSVLDAVLSIENHFLWSPDVEWTGQAAALTILQARPITTSTSDTDDKRAWYLTLRPGDARLRELRQRVAGELIPELEADGQRLASEALDSYDDRELADSIEARSNNLDKWKRIYWDEFIPFAHGVRRLATYYNDAVQPEDPYEFVGLLRNQPLLAAQRNSAIFELASQLGKNELLRLALVSILETAVESCTWPAVRDVLQNVSGGSAFIREFEDLNGRFFDIAYDRHRMLEDPQPLLLNLLELCADQQERSSRYDSKQGAVEVERRLLTAVGDERQQEAREMLEIGRISWKLRDDDNLLVARIESQLMRANEIAIQRLRAAGRVVGEGYPNEAEIETIVRALRDPTVKPVVIEAKRPAAATTDDYLAPGEKPRQLIGQPASAGLATGRVRRISGRADLVQFRKGEVLVCDAIQPTMTHLVPLAAAIVERRGGMLIHGAIIARELGIPCVNGVRNAAALLDNGDVVTVDGHLGIVTVGTAEFDLELHNKIGENDLDQSGQLN